jgi:hypothetical protein
MYNHKFVMASEDYIIPTTYIAFVPTTSHSHKADQQQQNS